MALYALPSTIQSDSIGLVEVSGKMGKSLPHILLTGGLVGRAEGNDSEAWGKSSPEPAPRHRKNGATAVLLGPVPTNERRVNIAAQITSALPQGRAGYSLLFRTSYLQRSGEAITTTFNPPRRLLHCVIHHTSFRSSNILIYTYLLLKIMRIWIGEIKYRRDVMALK